MKGNVRRTGPSRRTVGGVVVREKCRRAIPVLLGVDIVRKPLDVVVRGLGVK